MKKFKLFAAIFTVLFLSVFVINDLHASGKDAAGDKWEIISAKGPATCKLGAKELMFKVKIKNTGSSKTTGESIRIKINSICNGDASNGIYTVTPGKISAGKTTTLSVLCNNENIKRFANTAGSKSVDASFELLGFSTNWDVLFTVKVK